MSEDDRERWDRRHGAGSHSEVPSGLWLDALGTRIPAQGRALDVATGSGRIALWLAARGLDVTAVDISAVGLARCQVSAQRLGLRLAMRHIDLEEEPLPRGPWQVITCFHYLQRSLFPVLCAALAPGGLLICEIATRRNLERNARPSARFLLEEGELATLVAPLEIVHGEEDWFEDRALARVIARRT